MVVYTCMCLNVQVFGQNSQKQLDEESLKNCPFALDGVVVELIDPGFIFAHTSLVQRHRNDPWTEYICVPCHMRTHAVNVKANLLVVNKDLVVGEAAVEEMKTHPDFSKTFGLLLNPHNKGIRYNGVALQSHDALQKQLVELQSVVGLFLKEEENAMERRIQKYEQEQRAAFDRVTECAKEEKTKLVSTLFHNTDASDVGTATRNTKESKHIILSHSKSADDYQQQHNTSQNMAVASPRAKRIQDPSPDVFAMEEFDIETDEDSSVGLAAGSGKRFTSEQSMTKGSPEHYDLDRSSLLRACNLEDDIDEASNVSTMSTSVPISMPAKHFRNLKTNNKNLEDNFEEMAEFSDIPRQIQQLSESIQERDRYIFGDRPRQRVHTGDFTQVKWNM